VFGDKSVKILPNLSSGFMGKKAPSGTLHIYKKRDIDPHQSSGQPWLRKTL